MAKRKRTPEHEVEPAGLPRGVGEFLGVALLAIGALMLGGLGSYQFGDGLLMGPVGRLVAGALYAGFGMAGYLIVLGVVGMGLKALLGQSMELRVGEGVGFAAATVAGCVLLHVVFPEYRVHGYTAGGLAGELLGEVSLGLFDRAGTFLVTLTVMCLGLVASTPLSTDHLIRGARWTGAASLTVLRYLWSGARDIVAASRESGAAGDREGWSDEDEGEGEGEEYEDEEYEDEEYEDEEAEAWQALEAAERARGRARELAPVEEEEEQEEEEEEPVESALEPDDDDALQVPESRPKSPVRPGERPRRNRRVSRSNGARTGQPASEAQEEELDEVGAFEPNEPERRPEIVVPEEPAGKAAQRDDEGASIDDDDDDEAVGDPEDEVGSRAAPLSPRGKKAPPRVGELAAQDEDAEAPKKPRNKKKRGSSVEYVNGTYALPDLALFAVANTEKVEVDKEFVYEQAAAIEQALAHFRIKGKVTKIHPGPVITRYEFKPEAGVKVSRIQNLENDLAMALEAIRIRILAPIPGKSTVGLEVPNKDRETVYIAEILGDEDFAGRGKARLPMALGKSIVGKPVYLDMAKAPHMLVAGATGSGKSVGVNTMICSLLYTKSPEDVRMILIDPKMLEFSVYRDIPHLLLPVITDAEKANLALRWAVNEMERRYALLSTAGVRNLDGYNEKLPVLQAEWDAEKAMLEAEAAKAAAYAAAEGEDAVAGTELSGVRFDADGRQTMITGGVEMEPRPEKLPMIVVIIDEFADLMMVASKEVEANVARIAAKARAAGIHLIVATQRPSVDVITGTIKNNFPTRIAFQVTSDIDSRTILDQKGAKQLLGMGDMLYMDRGKEPQRVHGCFVSEREIEKVVDFIKKQAKPVYNIDIEDRSADGDEAGDDDKPLDPLYDQAVAIVAEAQKVSTSMLQRKLGVGYNRAAKIVEAMEEEGVIGPPRGTKPREVFVS